MIWPLNKTETRGLTSESEILNTGRTNFPAFSLLLHFTWEETIAQRGVEQLGLKLKPAESRPSVLSMSVR